MIAVKPLAVGPIVGETRPDRVRIWGRADTDGRSQPKLHGVVRVIVPGAADKLAVFKMTNIFDYTGVGIIDGLAADTIYSYQIGWFSSDLDTSAHQGRLPELDWDEVENFRFKSASADHSAARSYFVGSCRYNLPWTDDDKEVNDTRGDKTFKAMIREFNANGADGLIMLGDQIYADFLGAGVDTPEGYYRLYRGAFKQANLRRIMSLLPTYMTLDDHEIEDDWPEKRSNRDNVKLVAAQYAYQAYQVSHSPLLSVANGRLDSLPENWWYNFQDGCCEFFIMDVRMERDLDPARKSMIAENQMTALKEFLNNGSGRVKIIGSSVPFFPDGGKDKWSGFPEQRAEILDFIHAEKVRKVIFLGGDVHFSALIELTSDDDEDFKVLSIICSPFFWPFPHWAHVTYDDIETDERTYRVADKGDEYRNENFVRLSLDPDSVKFEVFPRKGNKTVRDRTINW